MIFTGCAGGASDQAHDSGAELDAGPAGHPDHADQPDAGAPLGTDAGAPEDETPGGDDGGPGVAIDAGDTPDVDDDDAGPAPDASVPGDDDLTSVGPFARSAFSGSTTRGSRTTPWTGAAPVAAFDVALVVVLPGFLVDPAAYATLVEHLSSWGYAAVIADPPAPIIGLSHVEMALDVRAVLDDLLAPGALPVSVDASRVALVGHSIGGKIAFMVAHDDARVAAVLGLDPVNGAGPAGYTASRPDIVPERVAPLTIPIGVVGELLNGTAEGVFAQACAPLDQNYQTFFDAAVNAPWSAAWTINGADHMDFVTDPAACGAACGACDEGPLDPAVTVEITRALAVAFLRRALDGDDGATAWLDGSPWPDIVDVAFGP